MTPHDTPVDAIRIEHTEDGDQIVLDEERPPVHRPWIMFVMPVLCLTALEGGVVFGRITDGSSSNWTVIIGVILVVATITLSLFVMRWVSASLMRDHKSLVMSTVLMDSSAVRYCAQETGMTSQQIVEKISAASTSPVQHVRDECAEIMRSWVVHNAFAAPTSHDNVNPYGQIAVQHLQMIDRIIT